MVKLWIDTATDYLFLAITRDETVVESLVMKADKKHSDIALYTTQELLMKHNIAADEIQNICIGAGPGSYSGIRIARMIAKTVQLIRPIDCYQFSTLQLIHQLMGNQQLVLRAGKDIVYARIDDVDCVIAHEEKQVVFDKTFINNKNEIKYEDLAALKLEDIQQHLPQYLKAAV